MSLQHSKKLLGVQKVPNVEEMHDAGTERKGIDGRMVGWMDTSQGGWEGWCNGGERRAEKAK